MADYINPTAIRPEYGFKPEGFLAGMHYDRDRRRYEDVSSLQDYMMKNQAVESGGKLQDYLSDAPVREAKRASEIATSNATASTIGATKREELTKLRQGNKLDAGLMASKITEAIAKAEAAKDTTSMQKLQHGAAVARLLSDAVKGGGPTALAEVMRKLESSNADPRIIEWFKNSGTPEGLMERVDMLNNAFLQASQQYRSTMDANKATIASRESEGAKDRGNQMAIAQLKKKDAVRSIDQLLQDSLKLKDKERAGAYTFIMNHPDATPQQQAAAQRGYTEAVKAMNLTAPKEGAEAMRDAKGNVILPGERRATYGGDPGPGDRDQSKDKFVKGKKYTDANGNSAVYEGDGKWRPE